MAYSKDESPNLSSTVEPQPQRSLVAEQVCVTLPTYGMGGSAGFNFDGEDDDRLIKNKSGTIRAVRILKDISFSLKHGERLAVLGLNGSGKTTLLQVLSGAIPPDTGRVLCVGEPTSLININLGMQMQASGHRNITLRGLASGFAHHEIEERRKGIAEFSELGDFLDLPVSTYSAGMRMRLSFAIVTSFDPEILILDEWLSAGDAEFREKASERMQEFADRAGILVLASHNRPLLRRICSKGIWLERGEMVAFGDAEDVISAYEEKLKKTQKLDRRA